MPVVSCPHCTAQLSVGDDLLGREVECGSCGRVFTAAGSPTAEEPPRRDRVDDRREDDDRPRRRRFEDDGDDRPRRRSRGGEPDLEWAEERVRPAATGLLVTGWLLVVSGAIALLFAVIVPIIQLNVPPPPAPVPGAPPQMAPQNAAVITAVTYAGSAVLSFVTGGIIVVGAGRLKRLESRGFATVSIVVAMLPCHAPCCLLGLIFGIMALVALNDPEVQDAFNHKAGYE